MKVHCKRCNTLFNVTPSVLKSGNGKYCSRKCFIIPRKDIKCKVCEKVFRASDKEIERGKQFCSYRCKSEFQRTLTGSKSPRWKGGKILNWSGYVMIYQPHHPRNTNRYIREHILVVEKALNRFLTKDEEIHHIDEVKDNNKPSNLYLFPNKSAHTTYHQHVKLKRCEPITESNLPL